MKQPSQTAQTLGLMVAILAYSLSAGACVAADQPLNIIFDTDMGGDCDDVGGLFILHGAVARGEAKLLATMGCISSKSIAPALDAINAWFGHPEIPVGTLKDPGFKDGGSYTNWIAERYPRRFATGSAYPDAVTLYRQILASQPDHSVTVVAVGPLRNLANLLKSKADAASPLDGPALIAKKVKELGVMGGKYRPYDSKNEKDLEYNFMVDAPSTALVCASWPTPVLWNGDGGSTCSGRRVTYEMPEHNPLSIAYAMYADVGYAADRLSWDPISCLVAVRGAKPWYSVVSGGSNTADAGTGRNLWKSDVDRGHSYLVLDEKRPRRDVETALEDMMVAGTGHPTDLNYNTLSYARCGMVRTTCSGTRDPNGLWLDKDLGWRDKAASSWMEFRHADGRKYLVTSYVIICNDPGRLPASVELSGSNDGGATWTRLDSRQAPAFGDSAKRLEFTVAKPAKWNSYRLVATPVKEAEGIVVNGIELNEAITCKAKTAVASLMLDQKTLTLPANGRATLTATLAPLNSFDRQVRWVSSDPAVAQVRQIGEQIAIVAAKKPGTCTITATVDAVTQTCALTVTASTLPDGWTYDELGSPPIPGAAVWAKDGFTLTGCGHAITSWWSRNLDQGVFLDQPLVADGELTACLTTLGPNVGGPNYPNARRPSSVAGLMIREDVGQVRSRFFLVEATIDGGLQCRWRTKTDDADDNQVKALTTPGKLPLHLRLAKSATQIRIYASTDGKNWGEPLFTHDQAFAGTSRIGLFVTSGHTFASTTATFTAVTLTR